LAKRAKIPLIKSTPELLQVAALPFRETERVLEICLVTTRETGRWTVPKGWPMKRLADYTAAKLEAEQEAGVSGVIGKKPIGSFGYFKRRLERFELIKVAVYPLTVTKYLSKWKEMGERQVHWARIDDAAIAVEEPELRSLLIQIDQTPEILKMMVSRP